ncbi:Elongation of very long chain fatty acids like protein [Argiope bruennichi]|uniref:Elongation of very long chain fatty acids protein n=1 Tax=Argiope bruennichi TaxID=94029 RepID=A0A8T0EXW1_ARGBR|nr:Elongation of very long chain fatty acids like protein [Argiope bruennichi]
MSLAATIHDFIFTYDIENKYVLKNPSILYSILLAYVLFVTWIGPALMENRKAFELKNTLIFYNFFQATVNAIIAYEIISNMIEHWDVRCNVRHNPQLPKLIQRALKPGWWLYLVKHIDLLDTVFFVLRKKQSQITFLHVFHHAGMCLLSSWGINRLHLVPGFYIAFGFGINTVIHVIMYTYYGLAAFGPKMRKYLWWKKYLTLIQIIILDLCRLQYASLNQKRFQVCFSYKQRSLRKFENLAIKTWYVKTGKVNSKQENVYLRGKIHKPLSFSSRYSAKNLDQKFIHIVHDYSCIYSTNEIIRASLDETSKAFQVKQTLGDIQFHFVSCKLLPREKMHCRFYKILEYKMWFQKINRIC